MGNYSGHNMRKPSKMVNLKIKSIKYIYDMKKTLTIKNIRAYIEGNLRYTIYNSWFKFLLPKSIREQVVMRLASTKTECINKGYCVECGCSIPALQLANKTCSGDCYPEMLNRKKWMEFKRAGILLIDKKLWVIKNNKFKKI